MQSFVLKLRKTRTVEWPPILVRHSGRLHSLADIFRAVDIDLRSINDPEPIGDHPRGLSFDLVDLHGLLPDRSPIVPRGDWQATALIVPSIAYVSGQRVRRPQGVMFDVGTADNGRRAREGCALAWRTIGEDPAIYLRTLAHEVGHLLNLRHPEEDTPPIHHGHTLMFETRSLARSRTYPDNIKFEFSDANADWLRTGPEKYVRPGGEPFGSRPGQVGAASMPPTDSGVVELAAAERRGTLRLSLGLSSSQVLPWVPIEFEVQLFATGLLFPLLSVDLDPAGSQLTIEALTTDLHWQSIPSVVRDCGNPGESVPSNGQLRQVVLLPEACLRGVERRTFRARFRHQLADGQRVDLCSPPIVIESTSPRCHADRMISGVCASFDVRLAMCLGGFSCRLAAARQQLESLHQQLDLASAAPRLALALAHVRRRAVRFARDVRELGSLVKRIRRGRISDHYQFEAEFLQRCCANGSILRAASGVQTTVR